jgi:hypothetical protein
MMFCMMRAVQKSGLAVVGLCCLIWAGLVAHVNGFLPHSLSSPVHRLGVPRPIASARQVVSPSCMVRPQSRLYCEGVGSMILDSHVATDESHPLSIAQVTSSVLHKVPARRSNMLVEAVALLECLLISSGSLLYATLVSMWTKQIQDRGWSLAAIATTFFVAAVPVCLYEVVRSIRAGKDDTSGAAAEM